jgi:hypothetical protein
MRALAMPALLALATGAVAAEDPMTAAEFDAYVTGKTLTYTQYGSVFGIEQYLPDRRVAWRPTGMDCEYGHWFEKGDLICFVYEYSPGEHCWTFWQEGAGLRARSVDDVPGAELSEVAQTTDGLNCPGPDVGV